MESTYTSLSKHVYFRKSSFKLYASLSFVVHCIFFSLQLLAEREGHEKTVLTMETHNEDGNSRVAEEGEEPNVEITVGLGTPVSPQLYKGLI